MLEKCCLTNVLRGISERISVVPTAIPTRRRHWATAPHAQIEHEAPGWAAVPGFPIVGTKGWAAAAGTRTQGERPVGRRPRRMGKNDKRVGTCHAKYMVGGSTLSGGECTRQVVCFQHRDRV
jgi:hypothetical protein